jgi:hypothetical protein
MSRVVVHLAELTGLRDRDVLDLTLVGVLQDLLRPRVAANCRCFGEPGQQRWTTRARLSAGDLAASADPLWADRALHVAQQQGRNRVANDAELLASGQVSEPSRPTEVEIF